MLYRVFPYLVAARISEPGGPLYVPRDRQGVGRHDHPEWFGALYMSRTPESAIAERIQAFRGQTLTDADLRFRSGERLALTQFDDSALTELVDLDDPAELARLNLRPSQVATLNRFVTREIALRIFQDGASGFTWWSSLEASWINITLFAERVVAALTLVGTPEPLTVTQPALRSAADAIGVRISS